MTSIRLEAYLDVERAMLTLENDNEALADALRDALDPLWNALSDDERAFLNRRQSVSVLSRGEAKTSQLARSIKAILETGNSVRDVIDKFAAALHQLGAAKEAELIHAAASSLWDQPSDVEQIAAWFDAQATKEHELLHSDRLRGPMREDSRERTQERWLVYKASAQAVRAGAWRKP